MKKYLSIALIFVLAASLLMTGCSKKKVSEEKLPGEGVVEEDTKAKPPGEEASITIKAQSSFSANYENDKFKSGRFAEAYIYTPGRNDVMTSQEQLYAPALWYETGNDSKDFPLKMPSDAQGGEIVRFRIVLIQAPLDGKPPAVTYTYKWVE